MSRSLGVEIGIGRSGDSGEVIGSRTRVLQLSGEQVAPGLEGAFAIVDADAGQIDRIGAALEAALRVAMLPGTEEDYLARLLGRVEAGGASIVLAVRLDRDVVVGACHDSRAYACNPDGLVELTAGADRDVSKERVRLARIRPSGGDSLVLASAGIARHVPKREVQETVCMDFTDGYSVGDAATWLATVASGRGSQNASAAIVHFTARRDATGGAQKRDSDGMRSRTAVGYGMLIGIAGVLAILAPLAALALVQHVISTHSSSKPPVAVRVATSTPAPTAPTPMPPRPTPVRATPRVAPAKPQAIRGAGRPLTSWTFPALPHASGAMLLALYNPQGVTVVTEVRISRAKGVDARRVRILPRSTVRLQLPTQHGVPALTVQVAAPIVPARLVFG